MIAEFEEQGDEDEERNGDDDQTGVNVRVSHHFLLPVDVPADAVLRAEHFGGHERDERRAGAVEQAEEHMRHGGRDTDLGDAVKAARAERRGDFKVGVRDGGDTAAREDGGREPDGERDKECTCGNRRGEGDQHDRDPCRRGDRAEHADERLDPVGKGLAEADGDAGQHADERAAEPADEQQACRVGEALGEERAVLDQNAEHAVERRKVQHRENGELHGQQVKDVEEQRRAGVEERLVFELFAQRRTGEGRDINYEVQDERRDQQPGEIRVLGGGVL